jgi:hypothetical protein
MQVLFSILSFTGFEAPIRAHKQADVLSTIKAMSQQLSVSINAPIEEAHLRCQSTTL